MFAWAAGRVVVDDMLAALVHLALYRDPFVASIFMAVSFLAHPQIGGISGPSPVCSNLNEVAKKSKELF